MKTIFIRSPLNKEKTYYLDSDQVLQICSLGTCLFELYVFWELVSRNYAFILFAGVMITLSFVFNYVVIKEIIKIFSGGE